MDISAYPHLLWTHLGLVAAGVTLFVLRGLGVLAGAAWPMRAWARRLSVGLDSALLLAGASLWYLLQLHPWRDTWLGVKLGLLLVYIVLGSLALKRAKTPLGRGLCFLAALACVSLMASMAVLHHPLGWLQQFASPGH